MTGSEYKRNVEQFRSMVQKQRLNINAKVFIIYMCQKCIAPEKFK